MNLQSLVTSLNNFTEALIADVKAIPAPTAEKLQGLAVAQVVNQAAQALTKANVGLDKVQNYGVATQALAEAAASNAVYMTPLRVKQLLDATKLLTNNTTNTNDIATLKTRVDNFKGTSANTAAKPVYASRGVDAYLKRINDIQRIVPSLYGAARFALNSIEKQIYFIPYVPPRDFNLYELGVTLASKSVVDSPRLDLGIYSNRPDIDQPYQVLGQATNSGISTGTTRLYMSNYPIKLVKGTLYWLAFRWVSSISNGYANFKSAYGKNQLGVSAALNAGDCGAAFLRTATTGFKSDAFSFAQSHADQAVWDASNTVPPAIYMI